MKKTIITTLATAMLTACNAQPRDNDIAQQKEDLKERTVLVAYFSATGTTCELARKVAHATGGELFEIVPETPYTNDDLDWHDDNCRANRESKDRTTRPAVRAKVENIAQYDTVFIGFPIWWGTAPTLVNTFLEGYDLSGKIVIPFATSGGSPIGNAAEDLKPSATGAKVMKGKVLNRASDSQVREWAESLKVD